jgi:hypothetical protein
VPLRQWVLSLPILLRVLLAAQPEWVTPVQHVVQRVVTRHLLAGVGLEAEEGHSGAVTLIRRFGSAANLDVHLQCLVLDRVYRCGADGVPSFVEVNAPTDDERHALLQTVIGRFMRMPTRRGVLIEGMGRTCLAEPGADGDEARTLRPLQATAVTCRIASGPRAGQEVLTLRGAMPSETTARQPPCADIELRPWRTRDHRGHPRAAGDREDPDCRPEGSCARLRLAQVGAPDVRRREQTGR